MLVKNIHIGLTLVRIVKEEVTKIIDVCWKYIDWRSLKLLRIVKKKVGQGKQGGPFTCLLSCLASLVCYTVVLMIHLLLFSFHVSIFRRDLIYLLSEWYFRLTQAVKLNIIYFAL